MSALLLKRITKPTSKLSSTMGRSLPTALPTLRCWICEISAWNFFAVAMTVAVAVSAGHAALLAKRHCPPELPLREAATIALAAALMGGLLAALPELPGASGLALTVLVGGAAYLAALVALEQIGLAPMLRPILADLLRRAPPPRGSAGRAALPASARLDGEEA